MVKKKVVWDEQAKASLKETYNYIKKDSPQQAERVRQEILEATKRLSDYSEMHNPDKYRSDKDTRFRAFEKHNYRISYFVTEDVIRVLRFRHVKQEPREY